MKKLENFSWKMWHVYTLIAVAVFFIGSLCSFFYVKDADYIVHERNYIYVGKGQRLTNYEKVKGLDTGFPILALSLKNTDEDGYDDQIAVGHNYIAFQDSKLGNVNQNEKDSEEYFKIRYYLIGEEKGEGHTIDVFKIIQRL